MTTVNVPDEVLAEAKKVARSASSEEVVVQALKEFAARHDQRKLKELFGTFRDDFLAEHPDATRRGEG